MSSSYEWVKTWRAKSKKNKKYGPKWMKARRKYWKQMYDLGFVKYENVPKSYRYWKDKKATVPPLVPDPS